MTKKRKPIDKIIADKIFDFKYIDDEERELIESIENGEWKPVPAAQFKKMKASAEQAARNTLAKNARVNIRMNMNDLRCLKAKAAAEGIPYQTLLSHLVHKYVSGQIKVLY